MIPVPSGFKSRHDHCDPAMASSEQFSELIAQLYGTKAESAFFTLISLPQSFPFVEAAYRQERQPERRAALIHCLWQYRNRAALPTLGSALRDDDDRVWKEALDGLVALGGAEAERVLRDTRVSLGGDEARAKAEWIDEAIEQIGESELAGQAVTSTPDDDGDPIERLAQATGIELVRRGGEEYVQVEDALRLLAEALKQGVGVLGVEGFNVDGQWLIPDIGTIVSFEMIVGPDSSRRRTEAAMALVKDLASEVSLVCITFE
jgi:hypothetical protein